MQAFIFDMDGVIIDSATTWEAEFGSKLWEKYFDHRIASAVEQKNWFGHHLLEPFHYAVSLGHQGTAESYRQWIQQIGEKVCAVAPLSPSLNELLIWLKTHGFQVGLVSSSGMSWINIVLSRIKERGSFDLVLSLDEHPTLKPKPNPSGYLFAIEQLQSTPTQTYILEDSTTGIKAGLASGAHTVWYNRYYSDHADMPTGYLGPVLSLDKLPDLLTNLLN